MDDIDRSILRELQSNTRITNSDLANRIGLSSTATWNRVQNLEREGVIEGYVTIVNQAALGLPDTVIVGVVLDRHDDAALKSSKKS